MKKGIRRYFTLVTCLLLFTALTTPVIGASPAPIPGDADGNGFVDEDDFATWRANYGRILESCVPTNNCTSIGDFNTDTRVNGIDFSIWRNNFGKNSPNPTLDIVIASPQLQVSPIPSTLPPTATGGIWTSAPELADKPMSGPAWVNVKAGADTTWDDTDLELLPNLANINSQHPQIILAAAIVYARTGQYAYRDKVITGLQSIMGTEEGANALAIGRNIAAYVVAADLIDYHDQVFINFLSTLRTQDFQGRTLISCHKDRPNNWGTMCGASRIAIDLYLGDQSELSEAIRVFKGWLGDRSAYANFKFQPDAFTWMCDTSQPRPVNPVSCQKDGHDLSGAPVDDVQRGGAYTWPPNPTHYAWGGLSAVVAQAEMLHRAGYSAYEWENQAIWRGMKFLQDAMASSASNPTEWMPWVVNFRYGTNFQTELPTGWGRLMAWTDYTHSR